MVVAVWHAVRSMFVVVAVWHAVRSMFVMVHRIEICSFADFGSDDDRIRCREAQGHVNGRPDLEHPWHVEQHQVVAARA